MSSLFPFADSTPPLVPQSTLYPDDLASPKLLDVPPAPPTILLAEDDEDILELTRAFLKTFGYNVLSCSNGRIAAEVFRKSQCVHLLVTDLRMPEISGLELARDLTGLQPALPVLMISGELITEALKAEMESRGWKFLGKPWTFPDLLSAIHGMLGSQQMGVEDDLAR